MNNQLFGFLWPGHSLLKRMTAVLEPLPIGAAVVNAGGTFLYANEAFCQLFERAAEDLLTRRFVDLGSGAPTQRSLGAYEQLFHVLESMDLTWTARTGTGREFSVAGHLLRVTSDTGDHYAVILATPDDSAKRGRRLLSVQRHMITVKLRLLGVSGAGIAAAADVLKDVIGHAMGEAADRFRGPQIERSTIDLVSLQYLQTLGRVAEMRDSETGGHMNRIGLVSYLIGRRLGMSHNEQLSLAAYAPLHDIGKIGIPDDILHAPRSLTDDEWNVMRTHTSLGEQIFRGYDTMGTAASIAGAHHERFNGSGYPRGAVGAEIPLAARVTAVADVYDAIRSERPYKQALSHREGLVQVQYGAGSHFDPDVVAAFFDISDEIGAGYAETPMFSTIVDSIDDIDARSIFVMSLE